MFQPAVGANITPSTMIGLHWMFAVPSFEWYSHATFRSFTFCFVICVSAEKRFEVGPPSERSQRLNSSIFGQPFARVSSSVFAAGMIHSSGTFAFDATESFDCASGAALPPLRSG